jgi:myosin-5
VFLRAGQMAVLEKVRSETLGGAATTLQRIARGFLARRQYAKSREAVLLLQSWGRGMLARRVVEGLRRQKAAVVVQAAWRRHKLRAEYNASLARIVTIQSSWRGRQARLAYQALRRDVAATAIQSAWRGRVAAAEMGRWRGAAGVLQRCYRVRVARRQLAGHKSEAREAGKLLEDKKALETKLKDTLGESHYLQGGGLRGGGEKGMMDGWIVCWVLVVGENEWRRQAWAG